MVGDTQRLRGGSPRAARAGAPGKVSTARSREGRPDPGHFCTHVPALRHSEDGAQVTPGLPGGGTGNGLLARSPRLQRHEAGWPRWAWSPGASASRGGRLY